MGGYSCQHLDVYQENITTMRDQFPGFLRAQPKARARKKES